MNDFISKPYPACLGVPDDQVRYELSHHFRGLALAYRFDFSSSNLLPEAHMSVEPGLFSTFEMAPIEVLAHSEAVALKNKSHTKVF